MKPVLDLIGEWEAILSSSSKNRKPITENFSFKKEGFFLILVVS